MSAVLKPPSSTAAPARDDAHISPREFFALVGRSLAVSYKARGAASCAVSVIGFVFALAPSVLAWLMGVFTDAVQGVFEGTAPAGSAFAMLAALMGVYVAQLGYTCLRSYFEQADSERMMRYIRKRTLSITCRVRMRHIDNEGGFAERSSFVDTAAGLQAAGSMQQIALWMQNAVAFCALAVVLAGVDAWMIVIVVVTALPSVILTYAQERERYRLSRSLARTSAFAQMYYQDATRFQTLQEVRFNRIFPYVKARKWQPSVDEVILKDGSMKRRHAVANACADLFSGSVYVLVLALAAAKIYAEPALGLGVFTLTLSGAAQMQSLVSQLFTGATAFVASAPYIQDFFSLEDFEHEPAAEAPDRIAAATPDRIAANVPDVRSPEPSAPADIVFENVRFTYPGAPDEALRSVSVTVREGERVAVVGRNGSGKSTFVNLLCGFYAPDSGKVTVSGLNPYEDPVRVRADLSAVFQDFARYEDTIRENIAISAPGRARDDAAMMSLAKKTGAAGTIASREKGLDDVVGSYSERGNNLSGGQWQRVAITRAAWRSQARIMLLDEPTSALDPMAEAEIYRNFSDIVEGRTALLVSHRLGIASQVDRVLVFDGGRIVEDGSPEELIAANGLFAELYRSQAQWYR
ncbi:ABC transporter ATP-binding protein [Adlercreutzia sp. ZJ473]|uniref:ABC transporter ATP-binding protein n=1 Tax=Adlercreutzia sp. ZJ473 TaxID=2722822 RepID=UPI0015518982|nr:ABC transporter ATP-binding protein [Adlercreutzia sp. ZJ473]